MALCILLLAGCGLSSPAPGQGPVPLASVDLQRMSGGWYILATMPNFLEHRVIAGYDDFTPRSSREIREDFYMRKGSFDSKRRHFTTRIEVLPNTGSASWRVHILGLVSLPFQVLYVDPDYRYALFGEQNRQWGWIYSRQQLISDDEYQSLLGRFKALGYDTSKFRKFVQIPSQIGQPGFWSDGIR